MPGAEETNREWSQFSEIPWCRRRAARLANNYNLILLKEKQRYVRGAERGAERGGWHRRKKEEEKE